MIFRYLLALLPMIITYIIGISLTYIDAYEAWYGVSPIMHSIGGFVTAWTAWMIWNMHVSKDELGKLPWYVVVFVLSGIVLMIGVLWEWHELALDLIYGTSHILGIGDTLIDLTMDTFGAFVYSIFLARVDK